MRQPTSKTSFFSTLPGLLVTCIFCCFLWGSAFPLIKIGYGLFGVASGDAPSQLVFAGLRFLLSGALVVGGVSVAQRRPLLPARRDLRPIFLLSCCQTIGQYFFFYLGLAKAAGVTSSIIEASATFFAIILAALAFHAERLTARKLFGCAVGFAGVVLVNLGAAAAPGGLGFSLDGEGLVLVSTVSSALSTCLINRFSADHDPVLLSGWQFALGGVVLLAIGLAGGGSLAPTDLAPATGLLVYLALVSAVAYSLWSRLLSENPVSRVSVFGFMNPVFGVLLSAVLLGEGNSVSPVLAVAALVLVSAGIILVNRAPREEGGPQAA